MVRFRVLAFALSLAPVACNLDTGSTQRSEGREGTIRKKPDQPNAFYVVDAHQGGDATRLGLQGVFWGRLVDVHGLDSAGQVDPQPVFEDFVIDERLQSDGVDYRLETSPLTSEERLVILRQMGAPDRGHGTFEDLLTEATRGRPALLPKSDDPTTPGPFSFVARNGVLVLEFDDLLKDDSSAALELPLTVRTITGYPPAVPFEARYLFDPNHGGVANGRFHSTRVLVDCTVSAVEAASMSTPLSENLLGLPPSLPTSNRPNVSLRIPTREDPASGQFTVLRSLGGSPVAVTANGPVDFNSPTLDVVRAMRSGNEEDTGRGFLRDLIAPQLVSSWPLEVNTSRPDPAGRPGEDFLLDTRFPTVCQQAPRTGDVLEVNDILLEVTRPGKPPFPVTGDVPGVHAHVVGGGPVGAGQLLGTATFRTPYAGAPNPPAGCWVRFEPPAGSFPTRAVAPDARVILTFSEPMDPAGLRPFDTMQVFRGGLLGTPSATNSVVATIQPSSDLHTHVFAPSLPLEHKAGRSEIYTLELTSAVDLGGNQLALPIPPIEFELDPLRATERSGGIVLRFTGPDEYHLNDPPQGSPDFRGQLTFDAARELVTGRQPLRQSWPVDQSVPVPALMFPSPTGTATPLSPLGSKLMTLWRHADVGWLVDDESKHNIDVEGLAWSPFSGQAVADFYESFEIRLGHSARLPDEYTDPLGIVRWPASGLLDAPSAFADNALPDLAGDMHVVHPRGDGYFVDPREAFTASSGTPLMPYPMNRQGGTRTTFTWRDTAVLATGGADVFGIPLDVEKQAGLYPGVSAGAFYGGGSIPSVGLPLLMEFDCFPSNQGLGTNTFSVLIGRFSKPFPSFRIHSTGGVNTLGRRVVKDPDLELVPTGGFDPRSMPAGQPTPSADPMLYVGQLETVVRLSRAHSVWFDAQNADPDWNGYLVEPSPAAQPSGTRVQLEFRGADGFIAAGSNPFDATILDAYGNFAFGAVVFHDGVSTWTQDLDSLDGAAFIQVRLTFYNNISTGLSPTLESLALSFTRR